MRPFTLARQTCQSTSPTPGWKLRPYQEEAVNAVMASLKKNSRVGMIAPTGSGKTEIFIEICNRWGKEHQTGVLILSHLGLLITQTYNRFQKRYPHIKVGKLQAGVYPRSDADVVIGTMQTGSIENHGTVLTTKLNKSVGLIIVDEAHYLYCDSYDKVFSRWPDAKILGVTATPFRSRQLMTNFFDEVAYSVSLQTMIDGGYLVKPELHEIVAKGDEVEDTLAQTVALYKAEQPDSPGIVYVNTIESALLIRQMFESAGIKARAVTSEITGIQRDVIFESFDNGDTQVLCNVNVLTAGFDSARVRSIWMPFGVGSPTQYLQRIGRGLRLDTGDKTKCDVYVFGKTPAIAGGMYQRFQREALTNKTEKEQETVYDDIQFGDLSKEEYVWTQNVISMCDKMKAYGHDRLADLLAHKDFPPKFMKNITEMLARMKNVSPVSSRDPLIPPQKDCLIKAGWTSEAVKDWTKGEASIVIGIVLAPHSASQTSKWILPVGKFAGKHIRDVPWAYKKIIAEKAPHTPIGKMIREFHSHTYGNK